MEIEKHLTITGNSTVSWKDAIVKAIEEASKTIDYLSSVRILEQYAKIDGNKISEYFVDLDLIQLKVSKNIKNMLIKNLIILLFLRIVLMPFGLEV